MTRRNSFRAALAEGGTRLGMWSTLCSPSVAELLARSAFDFVVFDAEHSPVEIAGLLPLLQAAGNGSAAALVRPAWNDPVLIKRVLDIGAQTVLVPFVESASEAEAAVRACLYPPRGRRGVAGGTRASDWGRSPQYLGTAADELCILVQVETGEALERLDEIVAVPGIDGVFVGPSDLAASMGHLGNPGHPAVQKAIEGSAARIAAAGKAPGILALGAEDSIRYLGWGYRFVACNVDMRILVSGVDALHAAVAPSRA